MLNDWLIRLRAILRRDSVEQELDEELRFHLEHAIERHVESGMSRADAIRQARLEWGGLDQLKESCRDARGVAALDSVRQDVRYGLRNMRRSPVFAATAVLTIGLSTAAIATVFTLGDALFFRPLPVDRPDDLVAVSATRRGPVRSEGLVSYPEYTAFRDHARSVSALAAHYPTAPLFVTVNGTAQEVNGAVVSANFLPMLGVTPAVGRFFRVDEDQLPDRDRVAVIADSLWHTRFAASPAVLGAVLQINSVDFTIVGVTPPAFVGLGIYPVEIYIPTMMLRVGYRWCDDALAPSCTILRMLGRLAPGRTVADAIAEFPTLMPASWAHAPTGENSGVVVTQPRGSSEDDEEPRLVRILAGVAIVLLLVACANLAGLLSAQSASRAREFAVRLALGAGAGRVVRQVMTESLLLAAAGAAVGVGLSRVLIGALGAMFFAIDDEGRPLHYDFSLTQGVVVIAIAAALAAGCLFSVIPAVSVTRRRGGDLKPRSGTARSVSGAWLLGAQAAVAVALVAVTGLMVASARAVLAGKNFEASHVALMRLRPRLVNYSPARAQRFQREVMSRLEATPGVQSASLVGVGTVLSGGPAPIKLPGWTEDQRLLTGYNEIGPKYFETLRTPLVSGREFDARDTLGSPRVAIVNETLAARLWPDGAVLGAAIFVKGVAHQVVGVVSDVPLRSRTDARQSWVFVPFWQTPGEIDSRLAIRGGGAPAAMLAAGVREVNRVDPDVPIAETITLPIRLAGLTRPLRVSATFVGYAAAVAIVLTAVGLYGALAFAVSQRTKEIGVRMALGAGRAGVLGLIVRDGMTIVLAGVVAGVGLAIAGTRLVVHLLYGSAAGDWMFYVLAALLILIVGFGASLLPARRAASVEPLTALRHD
jgi:putative ABC transport system permease protein